MIVRQARIEDAPALSDLLEELIALGKRNLPGDQAFVESHYISHVDTILCSVAADDDGTLLGLQILKGAAEGNEYDVTPGWGIIGTHVRASAARRGIGKALFAATNEAAAKAGLKKIDATIGAKNPEGLAYYEAIGFRTYRTEGDKVSKCFEVSG